jgi:hypothetical protein
MDMDIIEYEYKMGIFNLASHWDIYLTLKITYRFAYCIVE